ncbi:MAG TPA: transposase, partial [Thermoleophilaceae bacterium]|nr:transposase [Thermoleophilaceae bacterium]
MSTRNGSSRSAASEGEAIGKEGAWALAQGLTGPRKSTRWSSPTSGGSRSPSGSSPTTRRGSPPSASCWSGSPSSASRSSGLTGCSSSGLDAGLCVLALHPNQVKAARPRFRSQGKSERFDAWVLCELALTDAHRFRALAPDTDATKVRRAATRAREDLVGTRVQLANQLRAELERFWPGAAAIFAEVDSEIALRFLERYPCPRDARGLGARRLEAFLRRHRYPGRRSAAELLERLRGAPEGRAGELETEARRGIVLALVATLRPLVGRIRELEREIRSRGALHPDGRIFLSLFRDPGSVITAATLLAEIGDSRLRYPSAEALAADGGMSAVAVESGKRRHAAFRWACDKRLRGALATLANSSRHHNPWAGDLYAAARARGHDH